VKLNRTGGLRNASRAAKHDGEWGTIFRK
jgi:hypothetical protein